MKDTAIDSETVWYDFGSMIIVLIVL